MGAGGGGGGGGGTVVVGLGVQFGMVLQEWCIKLVSPGNLRPYCTTHLSLSVVRASGGLVLIALLMGPSSPSSSFGSSVTIGQEPPVVVVLAVMSQPRTSDVLVVLQLDLEPDTDEQETQ